MRRGNSRFTSPGSSTLVTPMPMAAKVWPTKSAGPKWTPRSSMPRTWSTSTASSARSRPSQRVKAGASGPNSPKQSEGIVVSRLASAPVRPRLGDGVEQHRPQAGDRRAQIEGDHHQAHRQEKGAAAGICWAIVGLFLHGGD